MVRLKFSTNLMKWKRRSVDPVLLKFRETYYWKDVLFILHDMFTKDTMP